MANKRAHDTVETSYFHENGHFYYEDAFWGRPCKAARTHQWVRESYAANDGITRELSAKRVQIKRLKEQIEKREEQQKLRAKLKDMEELRGKIKSEEEKLKHKKAALEQAQINQKIEAQKKEERKRKLKKTFAEAFKVKTEPEPAVSQLSMPVAKAQDVARMLNSKSDYECLQVRVGESAASIKKKYKELAMMFHPDKCKLQGAKAAFQRLHLAYNNLSRIAW